MTDLDKFKVLFDSVGCGYTIENTDKNNTAMRFTEGASKIDGYSFFYTDLSFDNKGEFIGMWVGE